MARPLSPQLKPFYIYRSLWGVVRIFIKNGQGVQVMEVLCPENNRSNLPILYEDILYELLKALREGS